MLLDTNIFSLVLAIMGVGLWIYHFAMGYGLGNHMYVGLVGVVRIALAAAIHRLLSE